MRPLLLTSSTAALLATFFAAASALAQSTPPAEPIPPEEKKEKECLMKYVCVGLGFTGQAGGNFLTKPDDQRVIDPSGQPRADLALVPDYPGFAGLTTGFGPFIELRILEYGGIEFGAMRQSDKGQAELKLTINGESSTFDVEIVQNAWHLPLLFKGVIPGAVVQPSIFIGPEFVIADKAVDQPAEIVSGTKPNAGPAYRYFSESYTALMFGIGLEFKLPIPVVDIRIPFSLRGSVNLGSGSDRASRETDVFAANGNDVTFISYKTSWQYQAVGNLGASIFF